MKLKNSMNGEVPFEGDRTFRWRTIPANAKMVSAVATVAPIDSKLGGPFAELLSFSNGTGDFGATRSDGTSGGVPWVEVDLHNRRTLAAVTGSFGTVSGPVGATTGGCTLQVDVGGGTYVEINRNGAFKTPSDPPDTAFLLAGNRNDLPGLTVAKLKATSRTAGVAPELTSLTVRSVPTQVSLRVGELPPFWTHVGEMTQPETTPDFAAVLQAALATAKVENGFYDLAVTVHTDQIGRLKVDLEIDFLVQQEVLPTAVPQVVLPFDVSTLSKSKAAELSIEVPANSRVVPGATSARIKGAFEETRVAFGPTGADRPTAAVEVSPAYSQAQALVVRKGPLPPAGYDISAITVDREVSVVAVDFLLEALTPSVRLQLDIRGDFDGKPDEIPLLPTPVEFAIEQLPEKGGSWVSVPLPLEFLFAQGTGKPTTYWLSLQSLDGRAAWSIVQLQTSPTEASSANGSNSKSLNTQRTLDGGLSWQDTSLLPGTFLDEKALPRFAALLRLREKPQIFKMPIELQIGAGENEVRKKLDRFEPLGRVDFTLDTELADGINEYLISASPAFAETEHLLNGDFEQWISVGRELILRPPLRIKAPAEAVAFAPDGTLAYVLDQGKAAFLLAVDVGCNLEIPEKRIPLKPLLSPQTFVISPDGTRAYITDGLNIQVVDLVARKVVGDLFSLVLVDESPSNDLALSPDGQRLYTANLQSTPTPSNRVRVIDTAKLEQQVITGIAQPDVQTIHDVPVGPGQSVSPQAVTVSADGTLLYLLIDGGSVDGLVKRVNTNTLTAQGADIPVDSDPRAIAVTPNGDTAVVANLVSNTVSIIDTATDKVDSLTIVSPLDVAISPDGERAYVLRGQIDEGIQIINLKQRLVVKKFAPHTVTTLEPMNLALAPEENHLFVVVQGGTDLLSVQVGTRVPAEWQVTSGEVNRRCLPPFHAIAELSAPAMPTAISQVTPVVPSAVYEFSFSGIASDTGALAEIIWLNSECGSATQPGKVAIEALPAPGSLKGPGGIRRDVLAFHSLRVPSPANVSQAEIRFSVPADQLAAIDQVSLKVTSEVTVNPDFRLSSDGELTDWTVVPAGATGFVIVAGEEAVELRNAGSANVELVQTVAGEGGKRFTMTFEGSATAGSSSEKPRIELRGMKADGSAAGAPVVVEILSTTIDSTVASGTLAEGSTNVELHLVVPPKNSLEVKKISLQYPATRTVPVKFIAEAPGELTISDVQVAFEQIEPERLPIPKEGLCHATPPGQAPGKKGDSCYCHQCEEETVMIDMKAVHTLAGRPAVMGRCGTCRTDVVRAGGRLVRGAEPLTRGRTPSGPIVVRRGTSIPSSPTLSTHLRLTDIRGIGEARAKQLRDVGIDTVAKLAGSTPDEVVKIRFVTLEMASRIIAEAKSLLT